ncbi:MAG: prepilin peptidase [Pseudomonadota bacterium]
MAGWLAATPLQGLVFGLLSLPICLWVMYTDLSEMKIRNEAVLALFLVFVVSGFFVIDPITSYLWRYLHLVVILVVGFLLYAIGAGIGAGDVKFLAAMAPFFALQDWQEALLIFLFALFITFALHRLIRAIGPLRERFPTWVSWRQSKKFPMGITLASTHLVYLGIAAFQ